MNSGNEQVVGSSILIIYDSQHVGAWVIDFAKTLPLSDGVSVTHRQPWQQGNHEEGWLTGIDNLIRVSPLLFETLTHSIYSIYFSSLLDFDDIQDIEALYCDASDGN